MINTDNFEFLTAHFSNNERTVATVYWGNKDETIEEIVKAEEDNPAWQRLLDNMHIDALHEATYNHIRDQRAAFEKQIIDIAERDGVWADISENSAGSLKKLADYMLLEEEDINPEILFKLKLAMFESELVSESKDRELKADLRKAKTFYDAMLAYRKFKG